MSEPVESLCDGYVRGLPEICARLLRDGADRQRWPDEDIPVQHGANPGCALRNRRKRIPRPVRPTRAFQQRSGGPPPIDELAPAISPERAALTFGIGRSGRGNAA